MSVAPFGSGLAIADWLAPQFYSFNPASGFGATTVFASGTPGLMSALADGSGNAWFTGWSGQWWYQSSGGALSSSGLLPTGRVYIGAALAAGNPYVLGGDGSVWNTSGVNVGSFPTPACGLAGSGSILVGILPASGLVGTMTTGGVTGSFALPAGIATPSSVAMVSGQALIVGGWQTAPALSGMAAAALDPQNALQMLAVGSGVARFWGTSGAYSENWVQTLLLTGLANLNAVAWRPDGTQAIATSAVSGSVQVLNYSASVLSLAQTLTISGACSVMVAGNSTNALVAQSGVSQLANLIYSGTTWVTGSPVTGMAGISAVAAYGASGAVAAVSGGIKFLNLTGGLWSVVQTLSLGFTPSVVTVDPFNQIFAAASGLIAVTSGQTLSATGSWSGGTPTAIVAQQDQVIVAVPADGLFRVFAQAIPGLLSQQNSYTLALGTPVGLALSDTVLFAMGSGATNTYGFSGAPFVLMPVTSGNVGRYNGSSWTNSILGIGHNPSAVSFDASGNTVVVTKQNTLWVFTSGGTFVSSGFVTAFSGQTQTTPLGPSCIAVASGHTYIGTCLAGVIVETS